MRLMSRIGKRGGVGRRVLFYAGSEGGKKKRTPLVRGGENNWSVLHGKKGKGT